MSRIEEVKTMNGQRVSFRISFHSDPGDSPLELTLIAKLESGRSIKEGFYKSGLKGGIRSYLLDLVRTYSSDYRENGAGTSTLRSDEFELNASFVLEEKPT